MEDQIRSEVLKTIPYGFYIAGVLGGKGEANGFTACWVSQVSFEPQQVILAAQKEQRTTSLLERALILPKLPGHVPGRPCLQIHPEAGARGRYDRRHTLYARRDHRRPALRRGLRPSRVPGRKQDGGRRSHRLPRRGPRRQPSPPR